jgi:hypothetical protein
MSEVQPEVPTNGDAEYTPDTPAPAPAKPSFDRKALVAELKEISANEAKAATEESAEPAPSATEAVPEPAGGGAPPAPKPDPVDEAVARKLAEREAHRETLERIKAEARAEGEKILAEARAKAKEEADAILDELRRDPASAVRRAGWKDPKDLILNLAEDGTPQSLMQRQLLAMQAQNEALQKKLDGFITGQTEAQKQAEQAQREGAWKAVKERFLTNATDPAKRPNLAAALKLQRLRDAFVDEAHEWARAENAKRPTPLSEDEIADHFERLYSPSDAAKKPPAASPPQAGGNRARSPSTEQVSERRSAPKTWDEMSPTERRKQMAKEAREAAEAAEKAERAG